MTDTAGATGPDQGTPVEQQQTPETPAAEQQDEFKLHPAWEKTLEVVPDILRPGIVEQIKTTEREHQKAIETARGTDVSPEFRQLAQVAAANGVTPEELVEAYNGHLALQEQLSTDPWGFLDGITQTIDDLVANGTITPREGARAKREAGQAAQDADDMLTPEQREIRELKERLDRNETVQQQRERQEAEQRSEQEAQEYGRSFVQTIHDKFNADPVLKQANDETRFTVGQVAAAILDGDRTGQITFEQAIDTAFARLKASSSLWGGGGQPAPQRATSQVPPVGGGSGQALPQQTTRYANEDERAAAMIAAGQRMLAADQ